MAHSKTISVRRGIIGDSSGIVKARIVAAGLRIGDVAREAGLSPASMSEYISGKRRNPHGQIRIVRAFRKLSGQRICVAEFWSDLWAEASPGEGQTD